VANEVEAFADNRAKHLRSLSPQKHYAECDSREKNFKTLSTRNLHLIGEYFLFGGQLFHDAPVGNLKTFRDASRPGSLKVLAAPTVPLRITRYAWRYQTILRLLRKRQDSALRWLLIARWLKQEGVCEPTQCLPPDVRKILIQRFLKQHPLSASDLLHRALIQNWQTYFERIRDELQSKKFRRRAREDVVLLGYNKAAVEIMAKKKSILQAVCLWLQSRRKGDARNLRNSYSRLHGHSSKKSSLF
jgi:hypothetical protein